MKVSVVLYNNNNQIQLIKFLKSFFGSKTDYKNVELIIADVSHDTSIDFVYNEFHQEIKKGKLILFSMSKKSPTIVRKEALKFITGDYVIFLHSVDKISPNFIEKFVIASSIINSDIIEFNVDFAGPLNLVYKFEENLIEKNKLLNIKEKPSIFSFASPFLYTKAFSKKFLEQNIDIFTKNFNFDEYINYLLLYLAKTYYFADISGITITPELVDEQLDNLLNQWSFIVNYFKQYSNWKITKNHIEYSMAKYISQTFPLLVDKLTLDLITRQRWNEIAYKRFSKEFPEFMNNSLIKNNSKIINSRYLKHKQKKFTFTSIKKKLIKK